MTGFLEAVLVITQSRKYFLESNYYSVVSCSKLKKKSCWIKDRVAFVSIHYNGSVILRWCFYFKNHGHILFDAPSNKDTSCVCFFLTCLPLCHVFVVHLLPQYGRTRPNLDNNEHWLDKTIKKGKKTKRIPGFSVAVASNADLSDSFILLIIDRSPSIFFSLLISVPFPRWVCFYLQLLDFSLWENRSIFLPEMGFPSFPRLLFWIRQLSWFVLRLSNFVIL